MLSPNTLPEPTPPPPQPQHLLVDLTNSSLLAPRYCHPWFPIRYLNLVPSWCTFWSQGHPRGILEGEEGSKLQYRLGR